MNRLAFLIMLFAELLLAQVASAMLWRGSNNSLLRANNSLLRPERTIHLLCTVASDGLLRGTNNHVHSAAACRGWCHTRRLCPRDIRYTPSDLLCTCNVYHGLFPMVVVSRLMAHGFRLGHFAADWLH